MAFTLRVTQGPGENEEFSFEGGEARLGRTADNDVVIKDPSSSRSHARVYEEEGSFFVEDLKSANGTRVNDKPVKGPRPISNGDTITIGDVVLLFEAPEANDTMMAPPSSTLDDGGEEEQDPNSTILKPPSKPAAAIVRKPPARKPARPEPEDEPEAEDDPPPDDEEVPGESTKNFNVPPPKALQRRGTASVAQAAPARASRALARPAEEPEEAISAADRARQRRELQKSATGRAQLLWSDLAKPAQIGLGLFGAVLAAGIIGLAVWAVIPKKVVRKNEPLELRPNGEPIPFAFGEGDGVDFYRPDLKTFGFSFASPTSIVGVLHYQARDISKDEVTLELNGTALGMVPPDTVDVQARQLEVVLPATVLKINEPNELVFDNVNNPPGEDAWRIWNIWVEVIPVPQMSVDEASNRAKDDMDRASKQYEMRQVGAMNLFRAWKGYRDAWLLLEATPGRPQDLLLIAQTRMREIRPELDRKCSAMLVDYQKSMNMKYPDIEGARRVLQNISEHFEKEHPCYTMSRGILRELDALDDPGAAE